MERWIDELADALDTERLSKDEVARLLGAARDVAHLVERKVTPLATFVLGQAVGRSVASGTERSVALDQVLETANSVLPPPTEAEAAPNE
jgi:Domain of unknown function (DUF6457)